VKPSILPLACAVSVWLFSTSACAYVIDTSGQWNGSDAITYLGNPTYATATYGQTSTVDEAATLESWSFWLSNRSTSPQPVVRVDGYLAEWAGDRTVGPMLYQSISRIVPQSPRGEFHELVFSIPSLALEPGKTYMMFLNTSNYATLQQPFELAALGATGDVYAGGSFWYQNSYNLFSNVSNFPWTCADEGNGCRYGDAAFRATLNVVPLPSTFALLSIGLLSLLGARRLSRVEYDDQDDYY